MKDDNIRKQDYVYIGQYKSPLLYHWLCQQWVNHKVARENNFPVLDGRLLVLDGHLFFFKKDWETIIRQTNNAIKEQNSRFFSDLFRIAEAETRKVILLSEMLHNKKGVSLSLIEKFLNAAHDMEFPWFFMIPIGKAIEELIKGRLVSMKLPENSLRLFFAMEKSTLLMEQKRDMANIKRKLSQKKRINQRLHREIEGHIKRYKWYGMMHFWGSPFTHEKFFEQIKTMNINEPKDALTFPFNKDLLWIKKQASELSYWRNHLAEVCAIASHTALVKLGKASKKRGLDYTRAYWLTPGEFLELIEGRFMPSPELIDSRKKAFGLVVENRKNIVLTGEKLFVLIDSLLGKAEEFKELKGTSANPGKAKGTARIVLSPDEISKVKEGDIMVVPETTPDFVPALHRVKAIITDMGGISSHAAIISREFGIPCVVGTGNSTRVIKDGDIVEVDANKGTIRKL